jgi:hypothetical protein
MTDIAVSTSGRATNTRGRLVRAGLVAAALMLVAAAPARAQLIDTMKFQTTFPFVAAGTTMPAGAYTVTPLPGDNSLMRLSNGQTSVLLFTENDTPRRPPRSDEVIFTKQGDTYVLREIWSAGTGSGVEPIASTRGVPRHAHTKGQ